MSMSDFTSLLAQQAEQKNSTPVTVPDTTMWASAFSSMGLPSDFNSKMPPAGLESTMAAVTSAPPIATRAQGIWDLIQQDSTSAMRSVSNSAKNIYGGIKDITKTVYGDASSAVGTVVDDVTHPVASALSGIWWYLIITVVVIGGVVYYAGKSGAVSVRV